MNATNAGKTITVYCRKKREDGTVKLMRRILKQCSWEERSISTALQTGNVLKEPASIRIFCNQSGLRYMTLHEWNTSPEESLDEYWTVDIASPAHTLIVPYESTWEPDVGTESEVTQAENNFIRQHPGALRVAQINDNRQLHGAHIRLQA